MKKTLVLGTGALGLALGNILFKAGYHVIFASRSGQLNCTRELPENASYECIALDLLHTKDIDISLFTDIDAFYFCATPRYWLWPQELVPLVECAITLATKLAVPFIYADNLYAYGHSTTAISEQSAKIATSKKGKARKQALECVLDAHNSGRLNTVIIQASDFYGPGVDISMVGKIVFESATQGEVTYCLGDVDKLHSFTYIDDYAQAMYKVRNDSNSYGEVWIAPCDKPLTVRQFVDKLAKASGQSSNIRVAPKFIFWLLGLRNKPIKELREVYYLYKEEFIVDSQKFEHHFKSTPMTIDEGIDITLSSSISRSNKMSSDIHNEKQP